jgi:hypothetical protein
MTSPADVRGELVDADGVRVSLGGLPGTMVEIPSDELEPLDVSKLPGARIVAQRGLRDASSEVHAGCARGPSDRWVDGIEGVLFERATALALRAARVRPDSLSIAASTTAPVLGQTLEGRVGGRPLVVEHALAFVGPSRDLELCSVVSVGAARAELDVAGELQAPPEPRLWMRAVVGAAEHPLGAAAIVGSVCVLAVAVLLWRRPRPRP